MDEYEAGRQDAFAGEVDFAWSDQWGSDYREGVTDALASMGRI